MTIGHSDSSSVGRVGRERGLRAATFAARVLTHPSWALSHVRNLADHRRERGEPEHESSVPPVALEEALTGVTGSAPAEVEQALAEVPEISLLRPSVLYGSPDASRELTLLAYGLCRLLRPRVVVETGVANGFTSAAILHALAENEGGKLDSIDLPHLHPGARKSIGAAVPASLRDRWSLHLGGAERALPRVLERAGQVDVFLQDAAHSVRGQLAEYRLAWPYIGVGGVLVSDDIGRAFDLFLSEVDADAWVIRQPGKAGAIGLVRKR